MIDCHCHLDLYPNPAKVARSCIELKVGVISVTTTPTAWRGTSRLAIGGASIHTAVGLHPQIAHQRKHELPLFEELLVETRFVGEIGLDGSRELKPFWRDQLQVFEAVLAACRRAKGRILSIHSRRATSKVLELIAAQPEAGIPILHWFSGSPDDLARANACGCWYSVGPAMLASRKGRALVSLMPRDRVLTESDGPFALIDDRVAMPWDVANAIDTIARLWRVSNMETAQAVRENFAQLLLLSQ